MGLKSNIDWLKSSGKRSIIAGILTLSAIVLTLIINLIILATAKTKWDETGQSVRTTASVNTKMSFPDYQCYNCESEYHGLICKQPIIIAPYGKAQYAVSLKTREFVIMMAQAGRCGMIEEIYSLDNITTAESCKRTLLGGVTQVNGIDVLSALSKLLKSRYNGISFKNHTYATKTLGGYGCNEDYTDEEWLHGIINKGYNKTNSSSCCYGPTTSPCEVWASTTDTDLVDLADVVLLTDSKNASYSVLRIRPKLRTTPDTSWLIFVSGNRQCRINSICLMTMSLPHAACNYICLS